MGRVTQLGRRPPCQPPTQPRAGWALSLVGAGAGATVSLARAHAHASHAYGQVVHGQGASTFQQRGSCAFAGPRSKAAAAIPTPRLPRAG